MRDSKDMIGAAKIASTSSRERSVLCASGRKYNSTCPWSVRESEFSLRCSKICSNGDNFGHGIKLSISIASNFFFSGMSIVSLGVG